MKEKNNFGPCFQRVSLPLNGDMRFPDSLHFDSAESRKDRRVQDIIHKVTTVSDLLLPTILYFEKFPEPPWNYQHYQLRYICLNSNL